MKLDAVPSAIPPEAIWEPIKPSRDPLMSRGEGEDSAPSPFPRGEK